MYAREGVDLDPLDTGRLGRRTSRLLRPLVDALRDHVLSAEKIHADDTPVPVLAPGNGKTKTGRLWTYVRDGRAAGDTTPPAVWFAYSPDRKGEHPRDHLKDFKGALQADAYAGFHYLYQGGAIYGVACWAHTRRKFHDIHAIHPSPTTSEALDRIGALYGIEEEIRGKPADLRREVRQARARPLVEGLRSWMEARLHSLSKKSETAGAILDQCAIHGEVLVAQQVPLPRLTQHRLEEPSRRLSTQQAVPFLGKRGRVPYRLVVTQAHEPAEQQVVLQLLHQHPLRSHRVQHLQQQRSQQLRRWNGGTPARRIHPRKHRLQFYPSPSVYYKLRIGMQWLHECPAVLNGEGNLYRYLPGC